MNPGVIIVIAVGVFAIAAITREELRRRHRAREHPAVAASEDDEGAPD
jgi:hypothetical protein